MMRKIIRKSTGWFFLILIFCFPVSKSFATTWFSYQSGNWNGTNIWTTDSTGTTLVGNGTPASNDAVYILTGRTIVASATISTTGNTITINAGAIFDLGSNTIPAITLNGQGKFRVSRVSSGVIVMPTITAGNFLTSTGGTVEYYGATGTFYIDDSRPSYKNLIVNLGAASAIMITRRNLTIYGNMTISVGVFQINDATNSAKRTIYINGNLTVQVNGKITTGSGNTNATTNYSIAAVNLPPGGQFHSFYHEVFIGGDFTNNGSVRFTNLTAPNYGEFANNGAVTVRMTGTSNNTLTCNGITDFYNLVIDKGIDQTYILTVNSSNVNNFAVYGTNSVGRNEAAPFTPDDPEVRKALWIKNGTLKLTGYILIPTVTEGHIGAEGNGDYAVGSNAELWVAGPNVSFYSTASTNTGFPEAPIGSIGVKNLPTDHQAFSIYGKLRVSDGYLSTRHSAGIIFWNTANSNSAVIVEGGTVNVSVMRTTITGSGKTSYLQTGGTVYIRGDETEPGEMSDYPVFSIPNPSSSFVMSGGDIIIRDVNRGNVNGNGFFLNCSPGNYSVTGGNITIETNPVNSPSIDVNITVNLWNMNNKRMGSSGNSLVNLLTPLTIANNLTVYPNATLYSGAGNQPVTVAGNFTIQPGGTYSPNNNTTAFNGTDNYFFWNDGTITNGLYNLVINKTDGIVILVSSGGSFTVRNDLSINSGLLADGGRTVYVGGNVVNSGTHIGAGKISLNKSTGTQTISGNGFGSFQNLEMNNTAGSSGSAQVTLAANIQVIGNLILTNDRIFDLTSYRLTLTELAAVLGNTSAIRFIRTAGNASDGGIQRIFADTLAFKYPLGTGTNYTPVTIQLKKIPGSYGSIAVKPVPQKHPFTTDVNCLSYYWKVEGSGFTGIPDSSVILKFNYGNLADNALFVPGKYVPPMWTYYNDVALVDEVSKTINFKKESSITGDYTSGIPAAFGAVLAFYSRASGAWNSASTWSNTGFGGAAASTIPGAGNPVFIGDGGTYNHTVTVSSGSAIAGSLSLMQGSTLNLGTTTGNNLGFVLPQSYGTLRISSSAATAVFPAGDFGNFLGSAGGIVEYYSGTVNFTLPTVSATPTSRAITNYCQLKLTPATGYSVTMPNTDLILFGNLTVQGASSTALANLNSAGARSLYLHANLIVNSGNLRFMNVNAQTIRIDSNIIVATGAVFNVLNSGAAVNNTLSIGGSIANDGSFDMAGSNTLKCDVTFTGYLYATISGQGAMTDFYSITVNKGLSFTPVLNVTSSNFTFSNNITPLKLLNGTFRLTSAVADTISKTTFIIPASTCLSAYGGTMYIATAATDTADVELIGNIEVKAGGIIIGNSATNYNNDIEYAGAGSPTIELIGGTLFVNGQIRRSLINGLGSLTFIQSGNSTVTVNGRNTQVTRGKLEVLNTGSIFDMTGGTLTIVRGAGTTNNDLYIDPESSYVTGGTIVFGNSTTENTNSTNSFTLYSTIPLYNLTVDGNTTSKTVTLMVYDLILNGNLVINATSVLNTDSLDVNIGGNFTNLNADAGNGLNTGGYRSLVTRQLTTFNRTSGNQTITGASGNNTNFANLLINNTYTNGTVTLQANTAIRVNTDLTLTKGTLADGGNVITVIGNINNSATHSGTGRITLAGSVIQILSGNGIGKFGNLYLNTTYNVKISSTMEITGVLTFQARMLDIGNNLLKLSSTSASSIAGSSATSYIRTNGLLSDLGVQKSFPTGALNFTFPIGVLGKYTPARMNPTINTAVGTITVIPVNAKHPCTLLAADDQLNYYWHVTRTGFNGYTISMYYTYVAGDVTGNEYNYVGDHFIGGVWDQPASGTVTVSSHLITFAAKNFIDGDYTAGYSTEFGIVPTYYSRDVTCMAPLVGAWDNTNTWSTTSHLGNAAGSYPTGQPVVIWTGHIVSTNGTGRTAFSLALNGTAILDLANTVGHNFSIVTGTGTFRLTPTAANFFVFPSGNFSAFMAPGGGTVQLTNTTGTAVFPYLTTYNKLLLKGAGAKLMIDADITLNGTLTNDTNSTFIASSANALILNENWINNGTFTHNGGTIQFNGTTTISGISPPTLNNLTINTGKTLTGPASATLGVASNWICNGTFVHNSGTVNFTGTSTISGTSTITFNNLSVASGSTLTGRSSNNMIMIGNWVNNGTFYHNNGTVTFNGTTTVSGGSITGFGKIIINPSCSLNGPSSGTMNVALDFVNDGTFNHNDGTLVFNGVTQSIEGASTTLFNNLTVASGSNTTINTDGETLRGVILCNGTLNANSFLTLLSDATQTALIDGTGTGDVMGTVIMQRYLASGFGYKYFSSPFVDATVGEFIPYMQLRIWLPICNCYFSAFYAYDENRFVTGWIDDTLPSSLLEPMAGYALNFGPSSVPITVNLSGQVNNGTMIPATLFNSNRTYTQGFNLMGNPYPSPIDWDSPDGWIRINIDNAIYYFDAGGADQWTGTYSTYINGISSNGVANNIIPAMQGFFIHVSNGSFPIAATYIMTNDVRVNNLSPIFHKKITSETRPLLRLMAKFDQEGVSGDPMVIYFDPHATMAFDKDQDALKLHNTDYTVPNLYALSTDQMQLSIDGIPDPSDIMTAVPLGIKIDNGGWVNIHLSDIINMPFGECIYLVDSLTGMHQNLVTRPDCRVHLDKGANENRFFIVFSPHDLRYKPSPDELFRVYSARNRLFVYFNVSNNEKIDLGIHDMLGREVYQTELYGNGYHELDISVCTGVYLVTLNSAEGILTKKVFLMNE
jgi:fibronectin-binding autotransporter adhesin